MTTSDEHFFDTVYYILDHVVGRPYGLWVHGNNDTAGAVAAVERLAAVRERGYELGGTLAATLMN